jgi:DNA-binding IclR family transcriptional regulator
MSLDYTVPAVDRAVKVLELLSASPQGLSLAQLAVQTQVPKSTLFRILRTLHQHGLVVEDPERKVFSLGMRLLGWGNVALARIDVKTIAHAHLLKLAHETRESFYLALLDHDEVVLVDRVDTPEIWKMVTRLGHRSPFHCTATGLVLVADMQDSAVDEMITRHGLKRFTSSTITSVAKLKKRLIQVRELGYSIVDGEYKPDLFAVAVPIWDHTGKAVASLMTAIPSVRSSKDKKLASNLLAVLKREAALISKKIGYEGVRTSS